MFQFLLVVFGFLFPQQPIKRHPTHATFDQSELLSPLSEPMAVDPGGALPLSLQVWRRSSQWWPAAVLQVLVPPRPPLSPYP